MNDEITKVLRYAWALIDKCGWQTGNEGDPLEGFCIIGAIGFAAQGNKQLAVSAIECVARVVGVPGGDANGVPSWNDKSAGTKEEACAALDRAVKLSIEMAAGRDKVTDDPMRQPCTCPTCAPQGHAKVTKISSGPIELVNVMVDGEPPTAEQQAIIDSMRVLPIGQLGSFSFPLMPGDELRRPISKTRRRKAKVPKEQLADSLA